MIVNPLAPKSRSEGIGFFDESAGEQPPGTGPRSFPDLSTASSSYLWKASVRDGYAERLADTEGAREVVVSRAGNRLAYSKASADLDIWRIDLRDTGRPQDRFITSTLLDRNPQFSPDGRRIAFISDRGGHSDLWLADADGTNLLQLTTLGSVGSPRWSPDSQKIAFDHAPAETADVYVINTSGGSPRRITRDPHRAVRPNWSGDGAWIYFCSKRSGDWQIWKVAASGEEEHHPRQITRGSGYTTIESKDGKYLYYSKRRSSEDSPQNSLWRVPVEGGEEKLVIEPLDSSDSNWDVTAEGIYFVNPSSPTGQWVVYFLSFDTGLVSEITQVQHPPLRSGPAFSVSPDGRWILSAQWQHGSDLMLLENFR